MEIQSFYGQFLICLQDYLKEAVPELRYVDQDLGQLETYEIRPAVSFPCLLVDFNSSKFTQLGQLVEMGDATIQFRLGFAPFSPSNSLAPEPVREKALNFYELENKIYRALKGWTPPGEICQPLNRIADATEQRDDAYRVRVLVFATSYQDDTATPEYNSVARPALVFEVEPWEPED